MSYNNQVLLEVISQCAPPPPTTPPVLATSKKDLSPSVSLAKNRIYQITQLRRELTDLFCKLPECFLSPQAE